MEATEEPDSGIFPITVPCCPSQGEGGKVCLREPRLACPKCLLVAYCSEECKKKDWERHKTDCPSPSSILALIEAAEPGDPAKFHGSFWAEYAATDVLNLEKNEGKDFNGSLDLLFLGESSLRHLIYTLTKISDTASPSISASINEVQPETLARTVLAVLLLTEDTHDAVVNAEAVVHLWYSARMPRPLFEYIDHVAGKHLITALRDVDDFCEGGNIPRDTLLPVTVPRGNTSIVLELTRAQWTSVVCFLNLPENVSADEGNFLRALDCSRHCEALGTTLSRMTPARAGGMMRWRTDGRLLPFGQPRDEEDCYNPLFFREERSFPTGATNEPLAEWPMTEVLDYPCGPALNDVYGKLFYYVRDKCIEFQARSKILLRDIRVMSMPLEEVGPHFPQPGLRKNFDRVEAGLFWDRTCFLSLGSLSGLVRHQDENPKATLLTITRESVFHNDKKVQKDLEKEDTLIYEQSGTVLDELAPPLNRGETQDKVAWTRRKLGLRLWRNWDRFSEHFLNHPHFFRLLNYQSHQSAQGLTATDFLGISLKSKNTIVRRWPNRLVHTQKDHLDLRDFNRWLAWGDNKPERWLEWKRFADVDTKTKGQWLELANVETDARRSGKLGTMAFEAAILKVQNKRRSEEAASQVDGGQDGGEPQVAPDDSLQKFQEKNTSWMNNNEDPEGDGKGLKITSQISPHMIQKEDTSWMDNNEDPEKDETEPKKKKGKKKGGKKKNKGGSK